MMRRTPSCRLLRRMPMQVDGDLLFASAVMSAETVPNDYDNDDSNDSA